MKDGIPELDDETLTGIVGAIAAYTEINAEECARMNLTFNEYATISPIIPDMPMLMQNRALGSFSHNLCTLMFRLGQQYEKEQSIQRE